LIATNAGFIVKGSTIPSSFRIALAIVEERGWRVARIIGREEEVLYYSAHQAQYNTIQP
jgi:hypothetical protein